MEQRQTEAARQTEHLLELIRQNTELTALTKAMSERIEALTTEVHRRVIDNR
jgi:hypothetical protein